MLTCSEPSHGTKWATLWITDLPALPSPRSPGLPANNPHSNAFQQQACTYRGEITRIRERATQARAVLRPT